MPEYPIYDLFAQVGKVSFEREGLYFCVSGAIRTARSGFLHLYAHGENRTEQLGLFVPQGDELCLRCRISCRSMDALVSPRFSIGPTPYRPLAKPLADGFLPADALFLQEGEYRRILLPARAPLHEDILPFFCFLQQEEKEGIPCLSMTVDRHGMPCLMC